MEITIKNVRGEVDLAMAFFECIDLDEWQRLRERLKGICFPLSGIDFIAFAFDERQPADYYDERHSNENSYVVECGIDKKRFLDPPDLKSLRNYMLNFIEAATTRMNLPASDKAPFLESFHEWRASL